MSRPTLIGIPLRKFGSQFSMMGLKQPGHEGTFLKPSRLQNFRSGQIRNGTDRSLGHGGHVRYARAKLSHTFQPAERTVHQPDILRSVSSKRNLRIGETNNENETHGAVRGMSCGGGPALGGGGRLLRGGCLTGGAF